jgi:hypothetical protein
VVVRISAACVQFLPEMGENRRLLECKADAFVDTQAIPGKCLSHIGPEGVAAVDSVCVAVLHVSGSAAP